jgi:hypothetical protein
MITLDKNKIGDVPKNLVSLRPFPYPFRAALALCSDIDGCDRQTFVEVHRFLNTKEGGVGLPVSDSFFAVGSEQGQMAYFLPDGLTHSKDADFILRAIKDGLIDSLHSWGDFNTAPPQPQFLRSVAGRLTGEFCDLGFNLKVWINHGSPNNRQNLKARLQPSYKGDDPQSPYYTSDLIHDLGIKFYWWSEVLPWPLSCYRKNRTPGVWGKLGKNVLKNLIKSLAGRKNQIRRTSQLTCLGQPVVLQDRSKLIGFTRFNASPQGVWSLPTRHTLRYSLSPRVLNELLEKEGYLILYTHLGLPREHGDNLFPGPDKEALFGLAGHYNNGNIWVAPTGHLLTYWLINRYLVWQAFQKGEKIVINLRSFNNPLNGPRLPLENELSGLCFYTPKPNETIIRIGNRDLPVNIYPPDHSGRASIGLETAPPPRIDLLE